MKKSISILISFLFIFQASNAQVYLGASSGIAFTKFRTQTKSAAYNHTECKNVAGFTIEVPVLIRFNKNVALQSGLSYLNMGTTFDPDESRYNVIDQSDPVYQAIKDYRHRYRLNYLSVPVTVHISVPLNKYSLYAKAGGYVSYLLYGTTKDMQQKTKRTLDLKQDGINRVDAGAIVGIGATRALGPGFIFIDARYVLGFTNLNKVVNPYTFPFGTQSVYNRGLFFNVGYMFNLGKS